MPRPRWILFDFWNTLARSTMNRAGAMAAFLTASDNPRGVSVEDITATAAELYAAAKSIREQAGWEISRDQFDRHVSDRLGLRFHHSREELDHIFAVGALDPHVEPGATETLSELARMGIKLGVLSNSVLSGQALGEIMELLGMWRHFAFVMTSADFGFRKPQLQLFKTALALADEPADKTWFIGDWPSQDVAGAKGAGMFAVWYNPTGKPPEEPTPDLTIAKWEELVEAVKQQI